MDTVPRHPDFHARVQAVHAEQRARGMQPRADSKLTLLYANGEADPLYATAADVAHELCVVDHIFRTTLYGEIIEEVMRRVAAALRAETADSSGVPRLTWTDAWIVVRNYVPTMLKLHSLRFTAQLAHLSTHDVATYGRA